MDNVLYFPTIAFPQTSWANRVLLYWDKIGCIIPEGFVMDERETLDPYTKSLLCEGLLTQICPEHYLDRVPNFGLAFLYHLMSLDRSELHTRQLGLLDRVENERYAWRIHDLKWGVSHEFPDRHYYAISGGGIFHYLRRLGILDNHDSWMYVNKKTFHEFMTYLALTLAQLTEEKFMPITNSVSNLNTLTRLAESSCYENIIETDPPSQMLAIQMKLIESALPAPMEILSPWEVLKFKNKYSDELKRLRLHIDKAVIEIAFANSDVERQMRMESMVEEIQFERDVIVARLKESGWSPQIGGFAWAALKEIPVIGPLFSFLETLSPRIKEPNMEHPLAYAALTEYQFGLK